MKTYEIIRFYAPGIDRPNETIQTGLTLEEAQEHCNDPDTREEGVFLMVTTRSEFSKSFLTIRLS